MHIHAIVVTYNRLSLLKENIAALRQQTYPLQGIYVVDNQSTDNTAAYLQQMAAIEPRLHVITMPHNVGGAGGFAAGLAQATTSQSDWLWVMDDDTIPTTDALERLIAATTRSSDIGFVCSKVVCPDGTPHVMNVPGFCAPCPTGRTAFNRYSTPQIPALTVHSCSFVSVLLRAQVVRQVGLPIAEFFIWADDLEYTLRITQAGYLGLYVDNSVVLHKTANYFPHPDLCPAEAAWKFYYQARNMIYIKRRKKRNALFLFFSILNQYRVYRVRIGRRPVQTRAPFLRAVRRGCIDGWRFRPRIQYLPQDA